MSLSTRSMRSMPIVLSCKHEYYLRPDEFQKLNICQMNYRGNTKKKSTEFFDYLSNIMVYFHFLQLAGQVIYEDFF